MTFDAQCNLYWSADGGEVFRVAKGSNQVTTVHDIGSLARGLVFNPADNKLYVGAQGNVYSMTTTGQNVQMVAAIGSYVNGMEMVPAGWGSFGGQLAIAHHSGKVYRLPTSGGSAVVVGTTSGQLSDLVFDGLNLYVANYSSKTIQKLSPNGTFTVQVTMPCNPDGVAVQENKELYVACGSTNKLYKVPLPNGSPTLIASPKMNGGWAPAGLIFDGLNDIVVMEDGEFLKTYSP
jgi:DNA-binding beta-propeller fold protein YncE